MVLGVSDSRPRRGVGGVGYGRPLTEYSPDNQEPVARPTTSPQYPRCTARLRPRPPPRRQAIPPVERTRKVRQYHLLSNGWTSCAWDLPQAASREGHQRPYSTRHTFTTQHQWQGIPGSFLGTNALWGHHGLGVLPGGASRPMYCAFHHGKRIYRIRHHLDNSPTCWSNLASPDWSQPGIL